jgi:ABC-2 type transport system permease protein
VSGGLAGTGPLVRLVLRRDRVRLPIWVLAIVGIVYASTAAVADAYTTPAQIQSYADTMGNSPAAVAMSGPPVALTTVGGIVVYETALTALVGVALMAIFLVVRHLRTEEEEGRTELLRSTVVGLHAPLAATMSVVSSAALLVGLGVAGAVLTLDVPAEGAVVYGAGVAALGVAFAGLAAATCQVMTHGRGAVGLGATLLAVAFLMRAVGDVRGGVLSWLSPIGWSQQVRAFDDNRWWPLAVSVVFAVATVAVAAVLATRRDLGSGLVAPRHGPAAAGPGLRGPVGLTVRLQRGSIVGWAAGVFIGGAAFGSFSRELETMVRENPTLAEYFEQAGGDLVESFLSTAILLIGLLGAGFAVSSALRLRSEELAGRAEPILATGVSRSRWLLSGLAVTVTGTVIVVAAGGLGLGVAHAIVTSDASAVPELLGKTLVYVPAVLVLSSMAVLLIGWLPRLAVVAWAVLGICFVIGWLGALLGFPAWLENVSPFTHTPAVPVEAVTAAPLLGLGVVVLVTGVVGLIGFRRRDIA